MIPNLSYELAGQKIAELHADAEAVRRVRSARRAKTRAVRSRKRALRPTAVAGGWRD